VKTEGIAMGYVVSTCSGARASIRVAASQEVRVTSINSMRNNSGAPCVACTGRLLRTPRALEAVSIAAKAAQHNGVEACGGTNSRCSAAIPARTKETVAFRPRSCRPISEAPILPLSFCARSSGKSLRKARDPEPRSECLPGLPRPPTLRALWLE
jgi:hypothetical protein